MKSNFYNSLRIKWNTNYNESVGTTQYQLNWFLNPRFENSFGINIYLASPITKCADKHKPTQGLYLLDSSLTHLLLISMTIQYFQFSYVPKRVQFWTFTSNLDQFGTAVNFISFFHDWPCIKIVEIFQK